MLLSRNPWHGGFLLASYGAVLFYVLNYDPGDQYVYFLSTYVPLVAAAAVGIGALIEGLAQWKFFAQRGWARIAALLVALLMVVVVIHPALMGRLPSLRSGVATFVSEDYQFPVENLEEPRRLAQLHLSPLPDDAVVLMEWRDLYAMAYLAYVEDEKPGISVLEALPRGNDGKLPASMVETIRLALAEGRPVFAALRFRGLAENFELAEAPYGYVQVLANP